MPESDAKSIASMCLQSWTTGDFETTRSLLDEDVTFLGPLGETEGADAYIDGLRNVVKIVQGADERAVFGEGDDVCIIYDQVTPAGKIPTAGWYHLRDGKIISIRVFFDPRPLMQGRE